MAQENNWWTDPKNKEEVEKLSWWNHEKNKTTFELPISVINEGEHWVATLNDDTKKYLGNMNACAQGKSKEEALNKMFIMIQMAYNYNDECRLNYQRWVPLMVGPWSIGGKWFSIFGFTFSFRVGKNMKGGMYIPFTKLNISISSQWAVYKRWKQDKKNGSNKNS